MPPRPLDLTRFQEVTSPAPEGPKPLDMSRFREVTETTPGEAALRGGMGGFFPFLDEATGAIKALSETKDVRRLPDAYRRHRDAERQRSDLAATEHPIEYRGSQVAGGLASAFVPGLNAAKGATVGAKMLKAAKVGGVYGLGESRADLTEGDVGGAALDAAKAAGTAGAMTGVFGAAGAGARKLAEGAARRVAERPATDLLEKVPATIQDKAIAKLGGRAGIADEIRADRILERAARKGPEHLAAAADAQLDDFGKEIGKVYRETDRMAGKFPVSKVIDPLRSLLEEAKTELDVPRARLISGEIKSLEKLAGKSGTITAEQAHILAQRYGRGGFGGNYLNPSETKKVGRDMYGAVSSALQQHVDEVATANNNMATSASRLRFLNERYSKLSALTELAEAKSDRIARVAPSLGERATETVKKVVDATSVPGAVGAFAMSGGNVAALAPALSPLAVRAAPYAARAADVGIATIYRVLQAGGKATEALKIASQYGIPRATAERMVEIWGEKD